MKISKELNDLLDAVTSFQEMGKKISTSTIKEFSTDEIIKAIYENEHLMPDDVLVVGAKVSCTCMKGLISNSKMIKGSSFVNMQGSIPLTHKDILFAPLFIGCIKTKDGICKPEIEDEVWKDYDESVLFRNRRFGILKEASYMFCLNGSGIIYATSHGQRLPNIEKRVFEKNDTRIKTLDENGYNMIANMERSINANVEAHVEYDENGFITNIPTTDTDIGYGHDYIKNPLPTIPSSMNAMDAFDLLKEDTKKYEGAIANGINACLTQDQFNALVGLRYNIGSLGVVDDLLDYIEAGVYERNELKTIVNDYYDAVIVADPSNERFRQGWYNRTDKMLDIFFDGEYGKQSIDAVNGKVNVN